MLMAVLSAQVVPQSNGLAPVYAAAAAAGDRVPAGDGILVIVKNTSAAAITVTLVTPGTLEGDLAIADRTYTVAATTGERTFPVGLNYRAPDGLADLTYSAAAGLSLAVLRH